MLGRIAFACSLVACGTTPNTPDSSAPVDGGDATTTDASEDANPDSATSDATSDADASAAQNPALWSKGFASTNFRGLHSDTLFLVDYSAGADIGTGALTGSGCIGVVVSDTSGAVVPKTPVLKQPGCSCWDGAHDNTSGSVAVAICASGTQLGCSYAANTGVPGNCFSSIQTVTPGSRTHNAGVGVSAGTNAVVTLDSVSGTFAPISPKQLGAIALANQQNWGHTIGNTNTAAIDTITVQSLSSVWLYGRQDGTSYDYSLTGTSTPSTGSGFFWAKYDFLTFSLQSVKQFGGTPLKAASDTTSDADEGISASVNQAKGCVTFAYTGTVDLGTGSKTATSASHSIILSNFLNGTATFVASYDKGPVAQGKTSTPHCAVNAAGDMYLVDTIWDWIDIAGTKVMAIHPNGDVLVAKISANGTLTTAGVYGGSGSVKGSGVLVTTSALIVGGQSTGGIDFGNGSLPAGAFIAGFPP